MKRLTAAALASVTIIASLALPIANVSAVKRDNLLEKLLDYMDKNGTYYYNPRGFADSCLTGIGSYDGVASAGLSGLQSEFVDKYHEIAAQLGSQYGIPWEAVVAQGILESASGTSRYARERNNFFGIGAVDSNPDNAHSFSSEAEGWRGYFEFITNNSRYRAHGAFDHAGDPYGYIQAIKAAGYATASNYVEAVSKIIKAIQNRASEKGWQASSELAKSSGSASSAFATNICASDVEGNGNLNSTALTLSWDDRSHSLNDPNSAYKQALEAVGLTSYGEKYVQIGASCDAFVATVLRFSGVDRDVPCCGTSVMLNYFASHPEKYVEVPNIGNPSNLQGGDIRIKNGHVEMYVVDENGHGRIASASHGDRTADHAIGYYVDSSYRIFRARS